MGVHHKEMVMQEETTRRRSDWNEGVDFAVKIRTHSNKIETIDK